MVQCRMDGPPGGNDVGEIDDPAQTRVEGPRNPHLHMERMAMQASARVVRRQVGEAAGCLKGKALIDFHGGGEST